MDVVYIVGNGSKWNDNELLFSLRSLYQYATDLGKVFIVGHKPNFVSDKVIHIPFTETKAKDQNIADKLLVAANTKEISANFLYMTDDVFFLKPFEISKTKTYHKGEIDITRECNYGQLLKVSKAMFENKGFPTKNFDTHIPIIMNKTKLKKAYAFFDYNESPIGYLTKTMYCNYNKIKGEQVKDNFCYFDKNWRSKIEDKENIVICDISVNQNLFDFLKENLLTPSIFEKENTIINLHQKNHHKMKRNPFGFYGLYRKPKTTAPAPTPAPKVEETPAAPEVAPEVVEAAPEVEPEFLQAYLPEQDRYAKIEIKTGHIVSIKKSEGQYKNIPLISEIRKA
jgi:hypothetical protein